MKKSIIPLEGEANKSGFQVIFEFAKDENESRIFYVKSQSFARNKKNARQKLNLYSGCAVAALMYVGMIIFLGINYAAFIFIPQVAFFLYFLLLNRFKREENRWHACEHKVANYFIQNKKDVSISSLKKVDSFHPECSSVEVLELAFKIILVSCFLSSIFIFGWNSFLLAIFLLVFFFLWIFSEKRVFISLMQRCFFLAEPSEKQYEETLKLIKEIEDEILYR